MSRRGANQQTNSLPDFPYSMRFAKAKVMLQSGSTYDEVKAATGLCRETISRVKSGEIETLDTMVESLRKVEVGKWTLLTHRIMDSITEEDLQKASLQQKVISSCAAVDKRELLAGRPTQRTEFANVSDEELEKELAELQAKLSAWEEGKIDNTTSDVGTPK